LEEADLLVLYIFIGKVRILSEKKIENTENIISIENFYKFIGKEKLMASKCKGCGKLFLPPRSLCTNCFSNELFWSEIETKGKIVSYTIIHIAPKEFQSMAPYVYAIIELDKGLRIPGIIREADHEKVSIGSIVELYYETEISQKWPNWPRYYFKLA
jgi:uncharacterized OB-fold protein